MISTRYPAMLGRASIALTLIASGMLVTAGEASALTATRVTRTSPSTSVNKSVTARCPDGLDLIGTGGEVRGGNGEVLITDIVPNSALTAVKVSGGENGGYPGSWTVTAVAVCSSVASSLRRISASSEDDGTSVSPKDASVSCRDGEVLLGMGYRMSGAAGNVFPNLLTPVGSPPDLVVVSAFEDLAYAPDWNLEVFGICGLVSVDVVVAMQNVGPDSVSPKSAVAECPDGYGASSAGGNTGGQPVGAADDLILERMTPNAGLGDSTTRVAENLGTGASWTVTAYLICID